MDVQQVEAIEAFSTPRQETTRHLLLQADRLNCPATDWRVINLVIDYFYGLAPCRNLCSTQLIERRNHAMNVSLMVFLIRVAPQRPEPGTDLTCPWGLECPIRVCIRALVYCWNPTWQEWSTHKHRDLDQLMDLDAWWLHQARWRTPLANRALENEETILQ